MKSPKSGPLLNFSLNAETAGGDDVEAACWSTNGEDAIASGAA